MRQGAAVPGTWKDDPTGSGTYGDGVTTKQADKGKLAAAFDPKAGVTASDEEDGDLTDKILVEGSVNTEKAGEYTLTYSVTDSEGASYAVKRVVTVKEKSEPATEQADRTEQAGCRQQAARPVEDRRLCERRVRRVRGTARGRSVTYSVAVRLFVDCRGLTREVKPTHPPKSHLSVFGWDFRRNKSKGTGAGTHGLAHCQSALCSCRVG